MGAKSRMVAPGRNKVLQGAMLPTARASTEVCGLSEGIDSGLASLADQRVLAGTESRPRTDAVGLLTFYLILLMAIPSSLVFAPLGAAGGPATLLAVVLMIVYLIMRMHPTFEFGEGRQPVRVTGIFFLCSILAAYVSANRHFLPRIEQNGADRGIISAVGWLAILLVSADGIDRPSRLIVLINRIVNGTTGLAIIGITQFFTGVNYTKYIVVPGLTFNQTPTDLAVRGGFSRPTGTTGQPLEFAAVMVIVFPLAIHQARSAPPELRFRRWLKVAIIAAAIPLTVSRTAILGLAVTAAVLLPTWPKRQRRYAYGLLLASAVALLIVVPQLLSTFASLMTQIFDGSSSTDSRTAAINQALPYISQHPWLGSGFGTFPPQVYFFTDDQYLNSFITGGVLGVCCLLALFLTGWFVARNLRRRSRDAEVRDLAQSFAAAVAVAAACFGTFDVLSFAVAAGLTFLVIGCIGAAWRLYGRGKEDEVHLMSGLRHHVADG
jgi:polysaccharide biosynthesis protein PslJ